MRRFSLAALTGSFAWLSGPTVTTTFAAGEQDPKPAGQTDCARCHSCDRPTHEAPCMISCTRDATAVIAAS
ncbi:MAG: hypothetical protein KJ749_04545, partial [Planctomycetes bacterium]|nr:hypothetical protein [Planctomycetota bacterium]